MRQIYDVRVYAPGHESEGEGLVGALSPIECVRTETLNGDDTLSMTHPYDGDGKWKSLKVGNVLKVYAVGTESPTEPASKAMIVNRRASIRSTSTNTDRKIYTGWYKCIDNYIGIVSSSSTITRVYRKNAGHDDTIDEDYTAYQCDIVSNGTTYTGCWIDASALVFDAEEDVYDDPARSIKISEHEYVIVKTAHSNKGITVEARHITTVLARSACVDRIWGVDTDTNGRTIDLDTAITYVRSSQNTVYAPGQNKRVDIKSTVNGRRIIDDRWTKPSTLYEILAGTNGLIDTYGLELLRENDRVWLMKNIGADRGTVISVGTNASDITITETIDKTFYSGVYAWCDTYWYGCVTGVYNERIPQQTTYPNMYMYEVKDDRLKNSEQYYTRSLADDMMRERVTDMLRDTSDVSAKQFGSTGLNISVELNQSGDMPEMSEPILLGDTVTVVDPRLDGGSRKAKIISMSRDCLTQRIKSLSLGIRERSLTDVIKELKG